MFHEVPNSRLDTYVNILGMDGDVVGTYRQQPAYLTEFEGQTAVAFGSLHCDPVPKVICGLFRPFAILGAHIVEDDKLSRLRHGIIDESVVTLI